MRFATRGVEVEVDASRRVVRRAGRVVEVEPRVFELLLYLVRHRDRVVPREELFAALWPGLSVTEAALGRTVQKLRRALGDEAAHPEAILTVRGLGYRFVAPIEAPRAASSLGRDDFTDRAEELDRLQAVLSRALEGRGGAVLIVGEPGIGKTRTLEEFRRTATAAGVQVRMGRGFEGEGAPSFWPWIQIFRGELQERDQAAFERLLGSAASDLAELIPELYEVVAGLTPPPPLDPVHSRFRVFDGVTQFLLRAAREQPLVLIFDDLHRADLLTVGLLRFLAPEALTAPLLLVGAYREAELLARPEHARVLFEMASKARAERIELGGLSSQDVARLVERMTGEPPDAAAAADLRDATGGNPFFVGHLIRHGRVADAHGQGVRPPEIREAVSEHLHAISPNARRLLEWAAVIGREFELPVLRAASGVRDPELSECLEAARTAHVLERVPLRAGSERFAHDLLREGLLGELSPAERARRHERVAAEIERIHADDLDPWLAALADHTGAAAAAGGDVGRAIDYALRAGARESERMAYETAADRYAGALALLESQDEFDELQRCDLLLALAEQHRHAGRGEAARREFERAAHLARKLQAPERLARAALGLAPGLFSLQAGAIEDTTVQLLEEALAAPGVADSPLGARILTRLATAHLAPGRRERAGTLAAQAVEKAERLGDRATLAYALCAHQGLLFGAEDLDERLEVADRIGQLARLSGERELELTHHVFRIAALLERGDVEAADDEIEAHRRLAETLRHPQGLWFASLLRSTRALLEGRFDLAEETARRLLPGVEAAGDLNLIQGFHTHRGYVDLERGRLPASLEGFDMTAQVAPGDVEVLPSMAFVHAESGRVGQARELFEAIAASGFESHRVEGWLFPVVQAAEVCATLEDAQRAAALEAVLRPFAGRLVVLEYAWLVWGSMSRILGDLAAIQGRYEQAEADFEAALALETRVGARPWRVRTQHAWARMRLRRGHPHDLEHARRLVEAALATTRELGMRHMEQKLLHLLPGF